MIVCFCPVVRFATVLLHYNLERTAVNSEPPNFPVVTLPWSASYFLGSRDEPWRGPKQVAANSSMGAPDYPDGFAGGQAFSSLAVAFASPMPKAWLRHEDGEAGAKRRVG